MPVLVGYLAAGLIGLSVALVLIGLGRRSTRGVEALARVGVTRDASREVADSAADSLPARLAGALLRALPGRKAMEESEPSRIRVRLDRAGLTMPAGGLAAMKIAGIGAGLLLGLLAVLTFGIDLPAALGWLVITALVGYLAPDLWVLNAAQRRQQQIQRSIPETLDLLALTAQAGLGLEQGIAEVANEMPGALGAELDRFLKEQQLGVSRREALQGLIRRNDSEDLTSFATALLQAEQLGTPISKTLQVQAQEMRRRRRARARERAGKAPVKLLFPLIFGIFPALFVIILGPGAIAIMDAFR